VDDEVDLVDLFSKMLQLKGIPVTFTAYEGHDAVRQYEEHNPKPCIVLMDYRLPTINGVETMKEMLQRDSKAKFVFISADASVKEEALKNGASTFLVKPVNMKDVIDAVEKLTKD
jgi:Response regulator containing CheY-like receiver, AAA-type ATPase, and DNA-binding domains